MYSIDLPPLIVSRSKRLTLTTTAFALGLNVSPALAQVNSDISKLQARTQDDWQEFGFANKSPQRQPVNPGKLYNARPVVNETWSKNIDNAYRADNIRVVVTGFEIVQKNDNDRVASMSTNVNSSVIENSSIDSASHAKPLLAWSERPT